MSRSKKRKQFAAILGASLLANKLGFLGGASKMKSDVMGAASKARKSGLKMPSSKVTKVGPIAPRAVSKIPGKIVNKTPLQSGPFKMFGASKMASADNIAKYKASNKAMRDRKFGTGVKKAKSTSSAPGFFGLKFDKPLFSKGKMIKARGGGMAKTKPTKMY